MAVELIRKTSFTFPRGDGRDSLIYPDNRRGFKPDQMKNAQRIGSVKEELDLDLYKQEEVGRDRFLRVFHGSFHLENYDSEIKTFVKVGIAEECVPNPDSKDGFEPNLVVTRASSGFDTEDFAKGAIELFAHNRKILRIPRVLRGLTDAPAILSGTSLAALSYISGLYLTGDAVSADVYCLAGGIIGVKAGEYLEDREQFNLKVKVPSLKEYYGNERGLERLEDILSHIKTVKFVNKIYNALQDSGVDVTPAEVSDLWRTNGYLGNLIKIYNLQPETAGGDTDKAKAGIFESMIGEIKQRHQRQPNF